MPYYLAIDSETTGLFIHKGCQAFTVSACSSLTKKIYLWHFPIDPMTRQVNYVSTTVEDITRTIRQHDTLIFHNANFDLRVLQSMGIEWDHLFENYVVHDTMVMSHAYRSSDKHGLKENAIQYCSYPDDDEKRLHKATISARNIARKLNWCIADPNNIHPSLEGLQKDITKTDYWVPKCVAEHLKYPKDHPWRHICDTYAGRDAERTLCLFQFFEEALLAIPNISSYSKQSGYPYPVTYTLYDKYNEARHLIHPLLNMQSVGIPVKPQALKDSLSLYTHRKQESLEQLQTILKDPTFNPQSPKKLASALFQELGFAPVKLSKSGKALSTDKDVIGSLLNQCEIKNNKIPLKYQFLVALKEFRKESTTLGYIKNYVVHSRIGNVIKPNFSQTRTGTGRLGCTDPNTTNVGKKDMSNPFADDKNKVRASLFSEILGIDTDHRFSLRNVFGPKKGDLWTCIDYDQFQLRIFAIVSESYDLIDGFERGEDIHQLVARIVFNKEDISDVERTAAKAINFGLLFGAAPKKIELMAGSPGLYKKFTDNFPKAKIYLETQSRLARSKGYVHTIGGYRLYIPRNAPHAASCYCIQGSEAEIVKTAMVDIHNFHRQYDQSQYYLPTPDPTYTLLMMIHDELVLTSNEHNFDELTIIMDIMENAGRRIGIPCVVDAKCTNTDWATRTDLEFTRSTLV